MSNAVRKPLPTLLLCATADDPMLFSQGAIFNSRGYPVIFAASLDKANYHLEHTAFDVAVLNHTLSEAERKELALRIKDIDPQTGVLVLHASGALGNPHADIAADSRQGPQAILLALKRVETMQRMRKTHADLKNESLVVVDKDRNYIFASDGACRLLGYDRVQFLELRIDDVVAGSTGVTEPLFRRYVSDGAQEGTIILRHRSGRLLQVRYEAEVREDGSMIARWHAETHASPGESARASAAKRSFRQY